MGANYRWEKLNQTITTDFFTSDIISGNDEICSTTHSGSGSGSSTSTSGSGGSGSVSGSVGGSGGSGSGQNVPDMQYYTVVEDQVLEFDPIQFGNEGVYRCVATSSVGEEDTITVSSKLHILKIPICRYYSIVY